MRWVGWSFHCFYLLFTSLIPQCWQHLVRPFSWIEIGWSQYSIPRNRWSAGWQTSCSFSQYWKSKKSRYTTWHMIMNYDNDIDRYFKGASTTNKKPTSEKRIPVPIITIYSQLCHQCFSWSNHCRKVPHKRWNWPSTVLASPFANLSQKLRWIMCWD